MKNNKLITYQTRSAIAITLLIASPLSMAANYDLLSQQPSNFGNLNQNEPLSKESWSTPSLLDSMQKEIINEKKRDYLDVFNLLKQNKLDEAGSKLASLLKQFPENPELYNLKALLETLKKDTVSSEKSYLKAISLDKNNILAHLGLSKMALDAGDLVKAKDYADKTLAINNKTVNGYFLLADIAFKQKKNDEVEAVLSTALEKVKGNILAEIEVIQNLGKFYAIEKQSEKTLLLGEDLVKRYPKDSISLEILAGAQLINNKKSMAEQTLSQLINMNKQDVENRLLLAQLLIDQPGKEEDVLKLVDEAIAIAPEQPKAYAFKSAYLISLKRFPDALELANIAEKQVPDQFIGKLLKGNVYLAEKKLDIAIDNYQGAYKKLPTNRLLFTIVDIFITQKKPVEAIKFLETELEKNIKNTAIHFKIATIYQQQKNFKESEKHYNAVLVTQPDNALALNNLAWIYSQENNPKAVELAKKAYTFAPESAAIADTYGYILIKQAQQQEEGLKILEKAAALAPKLDDIQFHLADAYAANGQQEKAIEILERITTSEQNFSEKQSAVDLLAKLKKK